MIETKEELKRILALEKAIYIKEDARAALFEELSKDPNVWIWRFQKYLRKSEYYWGRKNKLIPHLLYAFYRRKKNRLGIKLGIEIWANSFDEGLHIDHAGCIVVNGSTRVGKNCRLHGGICIGNDGASDAAPSIGDNVEIGAGAIIIGDIHIADNVKIGAGAVVVKSCEKQGATLVGVPAKEV